jgi:hypothetical protein
MKAAYRIATRLADRGNGTFTPGSPAIHRSIRGAADTFRMETAARVLFMASVTAYLLGRVFAGDATHPETVVYAATAAFGLDFLIASWRSLWAPS